MRALVRLLAGASLLGALMLGDAAAAAESADTDDASLPSARLRLVSYSIDTAQQESVRFSVRARFQREAIAGELREGGDFNLIGRFAKAGVGCDADTVFRNGFEN